MLSVMLVCVTKNSLLSALYEFDTITFISLFCENKTRPQLKCNGHCKLAQMAKEQDKKDAAQALNNLQQEVFLYYQEPVTLLHNVLAGAMPATQYGRMLNMKYSFLYLSLNDKPPQAISC